MKSEKQVKVLAIVAILIAVVGLSLGFAAFSETLQINGTGEVSAANWDIHFENLAAGVTSGTAVEVTAPAIDGTTTVIEDYSVRFQTPGDSISYSFDVVNGGSFDAEITSLSELATIPVCTGVNATTGLVDGTNVCDNLVYTLTYADLTPVAVTDTLASGATASMVLTLTYTGAVVTDPSLLPADTVNITGLGVTMVYTQD